MYALLLEKLQIELKYFFDPLFNLKLYFYSGNKRVCNCTFASFADKLMYMHFYVYNSIYMLY